MKKVLYITLFSFILTILMVGFIVVSYKLPTTIKKRSYIQVDYEQKPFLLSVKTNKYILAISPDTPSKVYKNVLTSINNTCQDIYISLNNRWISFKKHI